MTEDHSAAVISRGRLEMLVDGVFAIAMTILVLELKVPELEDHRSRQELGRLLLQQAPTFLSYLLSFFVLGMFWYGHNRMYRHFRTITASMLALILVQLAASAFFPFCAAMFGRYPLNRLAMAIYISCVFVYAWASAAILLVARRRGAMSEELTDEAYAKIRRRALRSVGVVSMIWVFYVSQAVVGSQASTSSSQSKDESAIRGLSAQWQKALLDRDAAGQAVMFAADGVSYHDGQEPLVGPAAVLAWEKKAVTSHPKAKITSTTDHILIAASGDLAVQTGEGQLTSLGENGEDQKVHRQRFVTVWKKVNGAWKVAHDIATNITPW
jgi:uncharacterized protein (TIGR02246 family)